jgi:hypothetical protein
MGKLHNAAYDIFIREYGLGHSEEYSKFDDVVYAVDALGHDLFQPDIFSNPSPEQTAETVKKHIPFIIKRLVAFADQQDLNIEDILVEVLDEYRKSHGS